LHPLERKISEEINEVWESVKDEAIMDNFNKEKRA
jgi:hypothetical protein